MPIIKDMPADIPTTNALASIPDDLLGPAPATIRMSGKDMLVMDRPPEMGEFVKMEVTMRCKNDGRTLLADGGIEHYRVMTFVAAKVTTEPYKPEPEDTPPPNDDPAMFDEDGNIPDDGDELEDIAPDSGLDEFDPEFSHNGK
ncbi:hypothetical protein ACX9NE_26965 [Mycobacterium sp. ML4]